MSYFFVHKSLPYVINGFTLTYASETEGQGWGQDRTGYQSITGNKMLILRLITWVILDSPINLNMHVFRLSEETCQYLEKTNTDKRRTCKFHPLVEPQQP